MSGSYVVVGIAADRARALAPLLSAQLGDARGENENYAVDGDCLLGRSGVDSLSNGAMPRYLPEQGLWGIFEGSLYEGSGRSPMGGGEALVLFATLWREGKLADELPGMNGAFFCVLWDPASRTLVCCNDRFGLYPMYWSTSGGRFCVAGRALCSVLAGTSSGEWDLSAVAQMLTTNDLCGETTLLKDVKTFPQATLLVLAEGEPRWRRYWNYDYAPAFEGRRLREIAETIGDAFVRAVDRQCPPGKTIGVTLSGGLDSRCILAAAKKNGREIRTFTWGEPRCYDRIFAREASERLGGQHEEHDYRYGRFVDAFRDHGRVVEGTANLCDAHMLTHADLLSGKCDVVLNGYAGDVIMGGSYLRSEWMRGQGDAELARRIFDWRTILLPEDRLGDALPDPARLGGEELPSARYQALMSDMGRLPAPDKVDRFILENRIRRHTSSGTVQIRRYAESVAPFFDYDLVDLETSVPAAFRFEHRFYLEMMRTKLPEAARIRWQRTLLPPGVPEAVSVMAKAALKAAKIAQNRTGLKILSGSLSPVDFNAWFRSPGADPLESAFKDRDPVADEVLLPAFCASAWDEHRAGKNLALRLGTIAALRSFSAALGDARAGRPVREASMVEIPKAGASS